MECLQVAWPLVLAMASNAIMMFADRLFLSNYSAVSIQAALPAGVVAFIAISFLQNVVAYSGTFVAQYSGAGARAACARAMGQGLWLSVLCIPLLLLSIPAGNLLFDLAGHAPEVVVEEKSYYLALVIGNIAMPFAAALSGFFTGQGYTRLVMAANVIGNAANVILDPFFIWGWCGLPELGIVGAGVATAISQFLILAILAVAIIPERHLSTPQRRRVAFVWKTPLMWRITRFGLPSGGHVLLDVSAFAIFTFVSGKLDAASFAASNIALSINHLIFAPLMGISIAATILTGQRMGDGDPKGAVRVGRNCVAIGWTYILICTLILGLFSTPIVKMFYPPDATFTAEHFLEIGTKLVWIFLAWAWFDTLNIILGGALKGAGDTRFVLCWIAGKSFFFWIPLLLTCYNLGVGIVGLWLTMLADVSLAGTGLFLRFLSGRWKNIEVIER